MGSVRNVILLIIVVALSIMACGKSPEKARKELGQMNIEYTEDSFKTYIERGDKVVVDLFLTAGMSANTRDSDSANPVLISAAYKEREEMVDLLLQKGADINAKGEGGITALMYAAEKKSPVIVQKLIEKGADVNAKSDTGYTALLVAVREKNNGIIKLLLDKGADVNAKLGADASLFRWTKKDNMLADGWTALHFAAANCDIETVKLLLGKSADLNANAILSPISRTCYRSGDGARKKEIVGLLKKAGAKDRKWWFYVNDCFPVPAGQLPDDLMVLFPECKSSLENRILSLDCSQSRLEGSFTYVDADSKESCLSIIKEAGRQ